MTLVEILQANGIEAAEVELDEGEHFDFAGGETTEYRYILDKEGLKLGDIDEAGNVRLDGVFVGIMS